MVDFWLFALFDGDNWGGGVFRGRPHLRLGSGFGGFGLTWKNEVIAFSFPLIARSSPNAPCPAFLTYDMMMMYFRWLWWWWGRTMKLLLEMKMMLQWEQWQVQGTQQCGNICEGFLRQGARGVAKLSCVSSSATANSKEGTPITEKCAINKRMQKKSRTLRTRVQTHFTQVRTKYDTLFITFLERSRWAWLLSCDNFFLIVKTEWAKNRWTLTRWPLVKSSETACKNLSGGKICQVASSSASGKSCILSV